MTLPIEHDWISESVVRLLAPVDVDAAQETATSAIAMSQLEEAARKAAAGPLFEETRRLAGLLQEAEKALAEATEGERQALAVQQTAWGDGADSRKADAAVAIARGQIERLTARRDHLRRQVPIAAKRARDAGTRAVEQVWRELLEGIASQRADVLGRIAAALAPLSAELWTCDQSLRALFDSHSGGVPSQILALLSEPHHEPPVHV